jgi:hypothetical protein
VVNVCPKHFLEIVSSREVRGNGGRVERTVSFALFRNGSSGSGDASDERDSEATPWVRLSMGSSRFVRAMALPFRFVIRFCTPFRSTGSVIFVQSSSGRAKSLNAGMSSFDLTNTRLDTVSHRKGPVRPRSDFLFALRQKWRASRYCILRNVEML